MRIEVESLVSGCYWAILLAQSPQNPHSLFSPLDSGEKPTTPPSISSVGKMVCCISSIFERRGRRVKKDAEVVHSYLIDFRQGLELRNLSAKRPEPQS